MLLRPVPREVGRVVDMGVGIRKSGGGLHRSMGLWGCWEVVLRSNTWQLARGVVNGCVRAGLGKSCCLYCPSQRLQESDVGSTWLLPRPKSGRASTGHEKMDN